MANFIYVLVALCFSSLMVLGNSKSVNSKIRIGNPNLEIIGGNEVVPHSAPEVVYVRSMKHNGTKLIYGGCGGTLLNRQYVLTAAHCVEEFELVGAAIGIHNKLRIDEPGAYYYIAKEINIHPDADIATFRLEKPVDLSDNIKAVKLPTPAEAANDYVGALCDTYGWGKTSDADQVGSEVLKKVGVYVISLDDCKGKLRPHGIDVGDGNICTLAENEGVHTGTCGGDSGGPLFSGHTQIGVTSYGTDKCEQGPADVYVRVGDHLDWIAANSRI